MKKIYITYDYHYHEMTLVDKINEKIREFGLVIILKKPRQQREETYDDNRVYRTNERQLSTRIDGCIVQG